MIKDLIKKHEEKLRQIRKMEKQEEENFLESIKLLAKENKNNKDIAIACYWETDINNKVLCEIFGYGNLKAFHEDMAEKYGVKLPCYICGADVLVYPLSKNRLANYKTKNGRKEIECSNCIEKREVRHKKAQKNRRQQEQAEVQKLREMPYSEYLETKHWDNVRRDALQRADYKCENCGVTDMKLSVHHKTYERRGCELPDDLIALCEVCHAEIHGRPIPKAVRTKRDSHLTPLTKRVLQVLGKT